MTSDFEVAIIGGGILGAGAAQACAAAGYRCVIIEKTNWAAGTSSKSSKLIHGGLRYLETQQFGLVRESLKERAILLGIAPELVHPLTFLIPVYNTTSRGAWTLRAGLSLYALLAGWTPLARFSSYSATTLPASLAATGLAQPGLKTVLRYWDAQTDDAALTRAVVRSAKSLGTHTLCPARIERAEQIAAGYLLHLHSESQTQTLTCNYLINAAGPWVNEVLAQVTPNVPARAIERVLGSHLVLEQAIFPEAFYLESPIDRRAVFVLPWKGRTLLGTTERRFDGAPEDAAVSMADRDYLLATFSHYFPNQATRIHSEFAGLRVLPKGDGSAFTRPRDCVFHVDAAHPRLLSLYGGKLTGYRHTGQDVVAKVAQALGRRTQIADTATLHLPASEH